MCPRRSWRRREYVPTLGRLSEAFSFEELELERPDPIRVKTDPRDARNSPACSPAGYSSRSMCPRRSWRRREIHDDFGRLSEAFSFEELELELPDPIRVKTDPRDARKLARYRSPAARVLVAHEPGAAAARDHLLSSRGVTRLARALDAAAWRRYERRMLAMMDAVVAFTPLDRARLEELGVAARTVCIPLGVTIPEQPLDSVGGVPPSVLFVGSFRHPPNVDAALRLAVRCFRAAESDTRKRGSSSSARTLRRAC